MASTEHLNPQQFTATYPPAYYSDTWDNVAQHPDFLAGGDEQYDLDELTESVRQHGVRNPVQINGFGEAEEGHHRVVAALRAGRDIPFQDWSKG